MRAFPFPEAPAFFISVRFYFRAQILFLKGGGSDEKTVKAESGR